MMTTPEPITLKPAPVFDLNPELLGVMLIRLPAAAVRVGHVNMTSTLAYAAIDEDSGREAEFLRDALTLKAPEMAEKWYGGHVNASRFAGELIASALAAHRKTADALP
jgi:hypothetical protein